MNTIVNKVGIIISTYNKPGWLRKTLLGYCNQTRPADEIVIADDGSGDDTRQLIDSFRDRLPIKHVWQEDRGFQKSEILNKALVATESEYLIFTDQDCIPREDFIETHLRYAKPGHFLSGGYFKMTMPVSLTVSDDDIITGRAFSIRWLRKTGQPLSFKMTKLLRCPAYAWLMNHITPARASWNGCNASGWRKDAIAVNGYNQDMHYGGQDREFGERLYNLGIKSIQIRYSAIVMHLDHKRPYRTKESIENNLSIRRHTRSQKIIQTPNGITLLH